MENKTIILSVKEGKRYEVYLFFEEISYNETYFYSCDKGYIYANNSIYSGSVSDFLQLPNKEEIAERVCDFDSDGFYNYLNHDQENFHSFSQPLPSLMSAIGEYKYIIITSA